MHPFSIVNCNPKYNIFQLLLCPPNGLSNLGDPWTLRHPYMYLNCSLRGTDFHFLGLPPQSSFPDLFYRVPFFLQCSPAWRHWNLLASLLILNLHFFSVSFCFFPSTISCGCLSLSSMIAKHDGTEAQSQSPGIVGPLYCSLGPYSSWPVWII